MTKVNEIWKDIPSYEGCYQINQYGYIKSIARVVPMRDGRCKTVKEKILRFNYDRDGYVSCMLSKGSITERVKIHRVVCHLFNGEPDSLEMTVNHKDGIKTNNLASNLEWCTISENIKHAFKSGLIKPKISRFTEEEKQCIIGDSRPQHVIAADFGVSQATISNIKRGKYV